MAKRSFVRSSVRPARGRRPRVVPGVDSRSQSVTVVPPHTQHPITAGRNNRVGNVRTLLNLRQNGEKTRPLLNLLPRHWIDFPPSGTMFPATNTIDVRPPFPRTVVIWSSGAVSVRAVILRGYMAFSKLGLSDKVIAAVAAAGYTAPTPIQEQAIPHVLSRRDVLGIAQTGTGKTAAFTLPMITMLETGRARARMPRTLILEPTRELAAQVEESFVKYGAKQKLNVALLIGGVSFDDQDAKLTRGVDVLIATPGRLLDHFERGTSAADRRRAARHRRSRPHARHGFHPGHRAHLQTGPLHPPDAVLHRDHAAGDPAHHRTVSAQSGAGRSRHARNDRGEHRRSFWSKPDASRTTSATRCATSSAPAITSRTPSCSAIASARSPNCTNRCCVTASTPRRCMATWTSRRGPPRSISSAKARSHCWWPPTLPPAASIFRPSATCLISTSPHHADDYVHRIGRTGRAGLDRHRDHDRDRRRQQVDRRDRETDRSADPLDGRSARPPACGRAGRTAQRNPTVRIAPRQAPGAAASRTGAGGKHRRSASGEGTQSAKRRAAKAKAIDHRRCRKSHLPAFLLRPFRVKA